MPGLYLRGASPPSKRILMTTKQIKKPRNQDGSKGKRKPARESIWKFGTINVRGLAYKAEELDEVLKERNIMVAAVTETKKKGKGTQETENYVQLYSGVAMKERARAGVMVYVHKSVKDNIKKYKYWSSRIIEIRIKIENSFLTVITVYAPEEGKTQESEEFYQELADVVEKINMNDYVIIAGDLNARIGNQTISQCVGGEGEPTINENGKKLRDFVTYNNLKIVNTFFKQKEIHKYTWENRGSRSLIDYIIANQKLGKAATNARVYRGTGLDTDHHLLVAEFRMSPKWLRGKKKKNAEVGRLSYKLGKLSEEEERNKYKRKMNEILGAHPYENDIEDEWKKLVEVITSSADETIGKKLGRRRKKALPVWNDNIKALIKQKKEAYEKWQQTKKPEDRTEYNRRKAVAKREVRKIKRGSWDKYVTNLEKEINGTKPKIYKVIKNLDQEIKERISIGRVDEKKAVEYYKTLWTSESTPETERRETIIPDQEEEIKITLEELEEALRKTKNGKAPGSDGINSELIKNASRKFKVRLTRLYNRILKEGKIPSEWRGAIVVPIFKKGDRENLANYRGISLLNTGYKIFAKIITKKLEEKLDGKILECQNGFRKGRSCIDAAFATKLIIEKRREFNLETHICFIDYEKAYDRINRGKLIEILEEHDIPRKILRIIQDIYTNNNIRVKTGEKLSSIETINTGVRQGCPMSCILFNVYINEVIEKWLEVNRGGGIALSQTTTLETLLFADDQVIFASNEDELQRGVYSLNRIATDYNMKISENKTKTMAFQGREPVRSKIVINGKIIEQTAEFNYLGCKLANSGEVDVDNKLKNFQRTTGLINRVLRRNLVKKETRLRIYNTMAIPQLAYGCEIWSPNQRDLRRVEAAEMRFLRSTAGVTLRDKKRSTEIRETLRVTPILEKITTYREKWKEKIGKMDNNRIPRLVLGYSPQGKRSRGRPLKRWAETM